MKLIHVAQVRDLLSLQFPFDPEIVDALKLFPGVKWHSKSKTWQGHRSVVEFALAELQRLKLAKFEIPNSPELESIAIARKGLRRYQQEDVGRLCGILNHYNGALLASVMGSGKTAISIGVAQTLAPKEPVLIFAPAIAIPHWRSQIQRWCGEDEEQSRYVLSSYAARGAKLQAALTCNPGMVILDEIHYAKNAASKRSQQLAQLRIENPTTPFLGLSGTPMTARPSDLWHPLNLLHPDRWGSKWQFERRYCGGHNEEIRIGEDIRAIWVADGATQQEELATRMAPIMVRRTHADIASELPALTRQVHEIEIVASARKAAKVSEKTRHGVEKSLMAVEPFKLEAACELAQEALQSGLRPLIVTLHQESAHKLGRMLECPVVTGETSLESRREVLLSGTAGVATMGSITTSIDLIEFDVIIFAGLAFIPSTLQQVEGRLVRMGRKNPVVAHYIVALGTFDEVVRQRVIDRLEISSALMGERDDLAPELAGGSEDALIAALLEDMLASK